MSKCVTSGSSLIIRGDSYHKSVEITRIEMEAWVLNIVPKFICSKIFLKLCRKSANSL